MNSSSSHKDLISSAPAGSFALVMDKSEPSAPTPSAKPARNARRKEADQLNDSVNGVASCPVVVAHPIGQPTIPILFKREGFPAKPPKGLADLPWDMWAPGQSVPLDRWVLGQHNRLLPAKVNARALIRLFADNSKGLPIAQTAERIATEAAMFGDYLATLDESRKFSRDNALSTAFPTTAADADRGRSRYANQFVVYQNGRGELSGLMVDLKLINVVTQKKERFIVPTRIAWEFAQLLNPVVDTSATGTTEKFSPEEQALLLGHIVTSVPVEAFAYRAILEAIQAGNSTPEKIDAALKAHVADDRAEKLSQSFFASQRSGAVSRMADLGLVERKRNGVRVYYVTTEQGRDFLAQCLATKELIQP
jgi:hypothetical protein